MKNLRYLSFGSLLLLATLLMAMQMRAESLSVSYSTGYQNLFGFQTESSQRGWYNADRYADQTFHTININGAPASYKIGDVDGDGEVNITDVALTVKHILGVSDSAFNEDAADINSDGEININDVMTMVDIILNGDASSRVMLCAKNIDHVAYKLYKEILDENDSHVNPDGWTCYRSKLTFNVTKNGNTTSYVVDDNIYLDRSDSHHGGMRPCMFLDFTSNQMYVFINSKDSRKSYSMDGYAYRSALDSISFTKETVFTGANWGWFPYFTYDNEVLAIQHFSYAGYYAMTSTRSSNGTWTTRTGNSIYPSDFETVSDQAGDVLVIGDNGATIPSYLACPDDHHPHLIDLGLPSGTKWACCNVADDPAGQSPANRGGYYAWGETLEKDSYLWSSYSHCDGDQESCHDIGGDIAGTIYDAAHVLWGGPWQMPTMDQVNELFDKCTYTPATKDGVKGGLFTGANGGTIFLPLTGCSYEGADHNVGSSAHYWSSNGSEGESYTARTAYLKSGSNPSASKARRRTGAAIRAVVNEPFLLLSTSEIDFGIVEVGVTKTYPLTVTNTGIYPEYIHATCQGDFSIAPESQYFQLEGGQTLTIDVAYAPAGETVSDGSLTLTTGGTSGRSETVNLRGIGTEFDLEAHVFPEVVSNSADDAETLLCDTLNGKYVVNYEDEAPDVREGSVVFVENDSTTYIVLVTKVTRDGNVVSFDGKRGDLSYVFHDVSFMVSTAADDVIITRLNGMETNKRVKLGRRSPRKVRETLHLFDTKKDFDITVFKQGDAKVTLDGSFHPKLDCEMYFEFYEPINDVFEGIAFTKAGLFRSGVKFTGDLKTTCDLHVKVKKKSEKYEYDEKEPVLRKKNILPKKYWEFVVFGVPVVVSFGCDLFEQAYIYLKGDFELYGGFTSTITGTYGFSYDPNDYFNGYVPYKDVDIQFEKNDPTVKGNVEAGLKAYLIPRFYARLYDLVGPCVELKPYFDLNLGGSFQEEFIDASGDYSNTDFLSTYMNANFGVDWGLGFSVEDGIEIGWFADKTWDMGKTFIDPFSLFKSPSDLQLVSESTKKVRKGQPIDLAFDAKCKFLWGTYTSPFFPVIKIDIPKRKYHTYLFTYGGNGKANYTWIPQTNDEELDAVVYDKDGKAVKTIHLPNPEDNSMRAITDEATDVKANSAVLNGKFDSGKTVVIDKMGFLYSSTTQVPKYGDENTTFAEVAFDDVMAKSRLVEGLDPGTTYYYRAYAKNRYGSNYGNVLSFTTQGQASLQLSTTTLALTTGQQETVNITSGSGSYAAVSSATGVATATVDGSKVIVKAVAPGTATITVKDNQTQARAKIEVTVSAPTLQLSANTLALTTGQQEMVTITSGSGSYAAVSNATNVATVTVDGSKVKVKGIGPGVATITVKDNQTQARAKIEVTVSDTPQAYLTCPDDHHPHLIDLGLPSGTKWACCNVGADKPEVYGGYYAWGETEEKDFYNEDTYIYCDVDWDTWHDLGSDIAGTQYDVAHVKWGGSWVMPSHDQQVELLDNCTTQRTANNGVNGRIFTGPSGGSIFLPAAGHRWNDNLSFAGSYGFYWLSTQDPSYSDYAYGLLFYSGTPLCDYYYRYYGLTVRPVSR